MNGPPLPSSPNSPGPAAPLVSILIPCYNAAPWIGQCIQSALSVPYPNKEVIVADDGSTDGSRQIIEQFQDRIGINYGPHAGANAARNILTGAARGEWLQYLDADDYILPGKVSSQIELIQRQSETVDVVYSPMICHYMDGEIKERVTEIRSDDEFLNYIRWEPFNTIGMLLRRETVLRVGAWRVEQLCCQEHELVLRLMMANARLVASRVPGTVARFDNIASISRIDPLRTVRTRMELTDAAERHMVSTGRLRAEHRRALFIARMEAARKSYAHDPRFAAELSQKAFSSGKWWTVSSPALPLKYQVAIRIVGFEPSEQIAARRRVTILGRNPGRPDTGGAAEAGPPLVSILIPCYNAAPWLGQAIQSALDQDYSNKEVIVVDDGSTDGSPAVAASFGDRIQFHSLPHSGGNAARNRLTELSRGEWLQYLDADDYLLPGKLSSQVRAALQYGASVGVIYSPVYCQDLTRPGSLPKSVIYKHDAFLNFFRWAAFQTTGMLFRRSAVFAVGGWKPDQPCCQEHELLLRLLMAGIGCRPVEEPLSVYRFRGDGSVSRKDPLRTIKVRMELTDRAAEYLRSAGAFTRAHRKAAFIARMEVARSAYRWDPDYAAELSRRAFSSGRCWGLSSPALPLRYQLALHVLGFRRAEDVAGRFRAFRIL